MPEIHIGDVQMPSAISIGLKSMMNGIHTIAVKCQTIHIRIWASSTIQTSTRQHNANHKRESTKRGQTLANRLVSWIKLGTTTVTTRFTAALLHHSSSKCSHLSIQTSCLVKKHIAAGVRTESCIQVASLALSWT